MGAVTFTARRSLVHPHVAGEAVTLEVDLQDAVRRRQVRKHVHRSTSGVTEQLYDGADTIWSLVFEPVAGHSFARLVEFLDSTASGEVFSVWVYGSEAAPIRCKRTDDGYAAEPFIGTGVKQADPFVMRITVKEAI